MYLYLQGLPDAQLDAQACNLNEVYDMSSDKINWLSAYSGCHEVPSEKKTEPSLRKFLHCPHQWVPWINKSTCL